MSITIEPNHPVFAGHFPAHPVVPGVLLLGYVQQIITAATGKQLNGLPVVKFHSPARPGDPLELAYELSESSVCFDLRCGACKVASGRFSLASEGMS